MFDIVKQSVFTALGVASLTRDKVEQLSTEIARRANLSEQEAKDFQAELTARSEQARVQLEAEIDHRIDHALIQLGILKAGVKREGEATKAELTAAVDQLVDSALARLSVARSDDVQALAIRLEVLEKKVAALS